MEFKDWLGKKNSDMNQTCTSLVVYIQYCNIHKRSFQDTMLNEPELYLSGRYGRSKFE